MHSHFVLSNISFSYLSLQLLLDSFTMNIGFCRFPLLTTQYSGVDFCYIYGYNGGKSVYREESRL